MKTDLYTNKILSILILCFILSCSSNDDKDDNCDYVVTGLGKLCNPAPNCEYEITITDYNENDSQVITVSESVYNKYSELYELSIEDETDVCWKE